ncbi:MAG: VOC family protein [Anaerolineaceae bacterium]|nr:VOC family protein [Anaerolineaceae bacterium]
MKTLDPYLTFGGNCREAMNYYREVLNGEITQIQTFGETNYQVEDKYKQRIMHEELKIEGIHIMASDGDVNFEVQPGNNVALSIDMTDEKEQARIFESLAQGGTVTMPLQETFWGAKFGMLTDRFGINWILNCPKQS